MPTTAPWIVEQFLRDLSKHEVRYVVLHGEDRIHLTNSDVDVAVSEPVPHVVAKLMYSATNFRPIMLWPYESGGAMNLFLTTPDMKHGAQIDLLFDPLGRGRLGLRSGELLKHGTDGQRFPTLTDPARLLYLFRKRIVKGDFEAADLVREQAAGSSALMQKLVWDICRPDVREELLHALEGGNAKPQEPRLTISRAFRRVFEPVGAWIHWIGDNPSFALELNRRASRILSHHRAELVPSSGRGSWWARRVQPVRLRPGIFSSWGPELAYPRADLSVLDGGIEQVTSFLSARLSKRLSI